MKEPPERERPLDAWETQEFDRIVARFGRTARRRSRPSDRAPSPVSARQVGAVLVAATCVAALFAALPTPLNLWGPVVLMALIMVGCLVWGLHTERRDAAGEPR